MTEKTLVDRYAEFISNQKKEQSLSHIGGSLDESKKPTASSGLSPKDTTRHVDRPDDFKSANLSREKDKPTKPEHKPLMNATEVDGDLTEDVEALIKAGLTESEAIMVVEKAKVKCEKCGCKECKCKK